MPRPRNPRLDPDDTDDQMLAETEAPSSATAFAQANAVTSRDVTLSAPRSNPVAASKQVAGIKDDPQVVRQQVADEALRQFKEFQADPAGTLQTAATSEYAGAELARQQADKIKRELIAKELRAQGEAEEKFRQSVAEGKVPALSTRSALVGEDHSLIQGVPAGHVARHVRTVDASERPSSKRTGELVRYGYRPHLDENGRPIVTEFGVQMICPVEAEAQRKATAEKSLVSSTQAERDWKNTLEEVNRKSGRTLVIPFAADEHRSR